MAEQTVVQPLEPTASPSPGTGHSAPEAPLELPLELVGGCKIKVQGGPRARRVGLCYTALYLILLQSEPQNELSLEEWPVVLSEH